MIMDNSLEISLLNSVPYVHREFSKFLENFSGLVVFPIMIA